MNYRQLLFEVVGICEELETKYCLCCGTAWALYRDGELFYDDDIDLYVFCSKEKLAKLFKTLVEKGFIPEDNFQNEGWEMNHHFFKYGLLCDIHYQFLKDEERFFEKLETVKYQEKIFNIPCPIEQYLELNYSDWKNSTNEKCRPLLGDRKKLNGGPDGNSKVDINKYLNSEGRWKG